MNFKSRIITSAAMVALTAVTASTRASSAVDPDYQRPAAPVAESYRDLSDDLITWKVAAAEGSQLMENWWTLFGDTVLDELVLRALRANEELHAAAARVEQSRAAAGLARGAYFPSVDAGASFTRERTSGTTDVAFPVRQTNDYRGALGASWELDLFGRVRRLNESARADLESSAAVFESVRLALIADLATNYVSLRAIDEETRLVADGVELRRRALELVSSRRKSGAATEFDVARAETELAATEAEAAALANRRASLQSALGVLVGESATSFQLAPRAQPASATAPLGLAPLVVPPGLPSELLERRPDIVAAERALAAANARIGVAKAAFFPSISLTGGAGFASGEIDRLVRADSRIWSIGPALYLPIFQGGRIRANLSRSRAAYDEAVALFRQQALVAFRETQDALTATRILADQAEAQERALASSRRAASLARKRYDAGFVNYFEVIDTERVVLATERATAQLAAQRLNTNVLLIKALGGGWNSAERNP